MIHERTPERNFFCQKFPADATTIRCVQNSWWIVDRSIIQQTKWSWNTAPIILGFQCAYISEYHINELRTPTTNTYNRRHEIAFRVCANRGFVNNHRHLDGVWKGWQYVTFNTSTLLNYDYEPAKTNSFLDWTVSYIFFPFYQRFAESKKDKTSRFHRHGDSTPRTDVSYSEFLSQLSWKINLWRDKKVNKRR